MAIPYFSPSLPLFNNHNDCLSWMVLRAKLVFPDFKKRYVLHRGTKEKVLNQRGTGFTSVKSVPKRAIFLDSAALSSFDGILPGAEPATRLLITLQGEYMQEHVILCACFQVSLIAEVLEGLIQSPLQLQNLCSCIAQEQVQQREQQ